jgi:hypothetical protein
MSLEPMGGLGSVWIGVAYFSRPKLSLSKSLLC